MPIARIPNKVLTLMQTQDKKARKKRRKDCLSSGKKKTTLNGAQRRWWGEISRGWESSGATAGSRNTSLWRFQVFVVCCFGSGRSWGKCLRPWGVSGGEVFTPSRAAFPGEAHFPFPESHVIYMHKKGTENNGWGSKQQLRVIFRWKENGAVTYLFSSHSEHIVCNRSFPIHSCILQYLLSFLFYMV